MKFVVLIQLSSMFRMHLPYRRSGSILIAYYCRITRQRSELHWIGTGFAVLQPRCKVSRSTFLTSCGVTSKSFYLLTFTLIWSAFRMGTLLCNMPAATFLTASVTLAWRCSFYACASSRLSSDAAIFRILLTRPSETLKYFAMSRCSMCCSWYRRRISVIDAAGRSLSYRFLYLRVRPRSSFR